MRPGRAGSIGRTSRIRFAATQARRWFACRCSAPATQPLSPRYDDLYRRGSVPSAALTIRSLSRLLQYALAISAWKQAGATRWALRCNPSSGNLHPTEGYLLIGALPGLGDAPGLYHYAPREHGLERRAQLQRTAVHGVDARVSGAGISGRAVVDPLARGMEVRRARIPLLPA